MMSFKYGVRDVRNLPGSDDAVCDKILLASAQSETEISESRKSESVAEYYRYFYPILLLLCNLNREFWLFMGNKVYK